MEILQTTINNATVLELKGHLNSLNAGELETKALQLVDTGVRHLVFVCEGLEYCSSAGLRVFLVASKSLKAAGGRCVFASLSPQVMEAFELTGFLQVMDVQKSVADAVK